MFATTERLNLRGYRDSDRPNLIALQSNQQVARYANIDYVVPPGPGLVKEMEEGMIGKSLMYVVIEAKTPLEGGGQRASAEGERSEQTGKEDDLFVGHVTMHTRAAKNRDVMVGIAMLPKWWGKGFGTEVMTWVIGYAFEQLAMHRVSLGMFDGNDRALNLYKKIGFVLEGRKRKAFWLDGKWVDELMMGILDEEWTRLRQNQ